MTLAIDGQPDCGCFGQVKANPWSTFCLDVLAIGGLLIFRPARLAQPNVRGGLRWGTVVGIGAVLCLAMGGGFVFLIFDNPAQALAHLRGELISVQPDMADLGLGVAGETRSFTVELVNHTSGPVRIVGGTASCNCIATKALPMSIAPGQKGFIDIFVLFGRRPGSFQNEFLLYTSDSQQPTIRCWFSGVVVVR